LRRYSFLLCPLLLSAALNSQTASPAKSQPAPTFESNVRVVLLDVVVTDSKGNPVTGLTQDDFRVLEDRKPQKLASFKEHKGALFVKDKLPPMPKNTYTNYPEVETADSINVILMDSLNTPILDQYFVHQQVIKYLKTSGGSTGCDLYPVIAIADDSGLHHRFQQASGSTEQRWDRTVFAPNAI